MRETEVELADQERRRHQHNKNGNRHGEYGRVVSNSEEETIVWLGPGISLFCGSFWRGR